MGKPKAPDPAQTAAVQGQWNSFTAQQQQAMNMIGQNTPWGSLAYQQTGTTTMTTPDGKTVEVPLHTANVSLSPEQQAIFDQTQDTQLDLAQLADTQLGKIGTILDSPFEFDNQAAANWAYDLGSERLDPRFAQEEEALRTRLINQGIRPGTAAYDAEMGRLGQNKNDAYNQLMLQGRSQAFNEALTQRNQPLNEIIGLMSGTQVQNPTGSFAQTPQSQVGGVDYSGLVNDAYQHEVNSYNSGMNALGGLFGLGAKAIFSDRRAKRDIEKVGTLNNGLGWYRFNYIWDSEDLPQREGVMSDEVRALMPDAVIRDGRTGFDMVDYDKALEGA